jgi:micrococcal nuclease
MRLSTIVAVFVLALVVVGSASASVRKVSFTSVVSPNDYASLTVSVAPPDRCTIKISYEMTVSHARGLGPKPGGRITWRWKPGGRLTWRWKLGSNTNPGRWPVTVDCGKSGKLSLRLRVLRG